MKIGRRHELRIKEGKWKDKFYPKPCADCGEVLTPEEELSLMPDGTTAGTGGKYWQGGKPKRPLCKNCASHAVGAEDPLGSDPNDEIPYESNKGEPWKNLG